MAKKKLKSGSRPAPSVVDSVHSGLVFPKTNLSSLVTLPFGSSPMVSGTTSPVGSVLAASPVGSVLAAFPVGSVLAASGSSSAVDLSLAASGSSISASASPFLGVGLFGQTGSLSTKSSLPFAQATSPPGSLPKSPRLPCSGSEAGLPVASDSATKVPLQAQNYASMLKSSAQLQELGTPVEHVSGAPFVLIPDENIEAAKLEFKDFIYARFHGDYPSMGKIIGVVNAVWARTGPRIFVHNIGEGIYLLRVTNPRTREVLLSRTCWNIGGLPMFVAPWSPDYSPDEAPLTSAIVPVEMRNVPYLLFNNESLSRLATAIGKPESLAPETERKENFEVAKLFVRVDLTEPLPHQIVSGFSNGREVMIAVSYPWLPVKCELCKKYGHNPIKCPEAPIRSKGVKSPPPPPPPPPLSKSARRRSRSRPGRYTEKKVKQGTLRYVPVQRSSSQVANDVASTDLQVLPANEATSQEDSVGDLEEGEIPQLTCNEDPSVAEMATSQIAPATDLISTQSPLPVAPLQRISFGAFDVLATLSSADSDDDILSLPSEDSITAISVNGKADDAVGIAAAASTPDCNTDNNIHPVEEHERYNPFFLVGNRKSGRKVTKNL